MSFSHTFVFFSVFFVTYRMRYDTYAIDLLYVRSRVNLYPGKSAAGINPLNRRTLYFLGTGYSKRFNSHTATAYEFYETSLLLKQAIGVSGMLEEMTEDEEIKKKVNVSTYLKTATRRLFRG